MPEVSVRRCPTVSLCVHINMCKTEHKLSLVQTFPSIFLRPFSELNQFQELLKASTFPRLFFGSNFNYRIVKNISYT